MPLAQSHSKGCLRHNIRMFLLTSHAKDRKMSLNLLGAYGSDDDNSDDNEEDFFNQKGNSEATNDKRSDSDAQPDKEEDESELAACSPSASKSIQSALLRGGDTSSDDEDARPQKSSKPISASVPSIPPPKLPKLKAPRFDPSKCSETACSVFMNDMKREELLNKRILSQHVSLTDFKEVDPRKKMGPCRAFKRGECRRGDKCRFFHATPEDRTVFDKTEAVVSSTPTLYKAEPDVFKKRKMN